MDKVHEWLKNDSKQYSKHQLENLREVIKDDIMEFVDCYDYRQLACKIVEDRFKELFDEQATYIETYSESVRASDEECQL